ncbi:helix-turn-helix domain-containing protein, partial [Klebsiella pneumoniae]|uniref:helix-turn-helix domain-containing protein n=2 Tax=Klebsiella pneumoniae TaxID=573 RepID=UPI00350E8FB9
SDMFIRVVTLCFVTLVLTACVTGEKFAKISQGMSQEKTAELANFHRTYVSQLERCVTNISIDGLERLAYALEVDVTELLRIPDAD